MKWDNLRVFLAVARAGQILGAARKLGLDQATASRRIGALEADLGATLFERHTSGVILTPAGERLLPIAERMESDAMQAQSAVGQGDVSLAGTVRIGAPDGFGNFFLAPLLTEMAEAHRELRIQLVPLPRSFSLSKREADIAITLERPTEGRLFARKLTDYTLGLYASRAYLDRVGPVETMDDLRKCLFVTYVQDLIWSPALDYGQPFLDRCRQVLECASIVGQMQALARGGVGIVHDYTAANVPGLVPVLPEVSLTLSYWIVSHADVRGLRRVTELIDFITARVEASRTAFVRG
ncbi:MAG: LysR family transcriptional regulator [Rhodobiaceae bacterium]|nr:LysR family transcriptional regulator [Rhodobiaceae bacterium]MCC0016199.1 LysR family transcriptional regulator [Rhodobiaceae bacterium]MCC0041196.1 LysR family transcriptional regulator [Rhodobiaceae bacterium]